MSLTGCDPAESTAVRPRCCSYRDRRGVGGACATAPGNKRHTDRPPAIVRPSYKGRLLDVLWKDKSGSLEAQYNCVRVSMPALCAINTASRPIEGMPETRGGLHVCLRVRVHICVRRLAFLPFFFIANAGVKLWCDLFYFKMYQKVLWTRKWKYFLTHT